MCLRLPCLIDFTCALAWLSGPEFKVNTPTESNLSVIREVDTIRIKNIIICSFFYNMIKLSVRLEPVHTCISDRLLLLQPSV